MNNVFPFFIQN